MKKSLVLLSNVCLGLALIITVYNFLIIEKPVSNQVTGVILVLVIASIALTRNKLERVPEK